MLENMTGEQLSGWLAYYNLESFGFDIENYRAGIIASSVLNSVRGKSTDKVWTYQDFFSKQSPIQDWHEQYSVAETICNLYGGKE